MNLWGGGLNALQYLAPYIFRVAISNNRILTLEGDRVTFRYRATETGAEKCCTLGAEEFIHRFLQHVLPKGFVKVRYYGLFSPGLRKPLAALRQQLQDSSASPPVPSETRDGNSQSAETDSAAPTHRCPVCGHPMQLGAFTPPSGLSPP